MTARPIRWLLAAGAALLTLVGPGAATAAPVAVPLVDDGEPGIKLQGGVAQFQGGVTVPGRWSSWSGRLVLRWGASGQLAPGSALRATVGGRVVGTRELDGSAGSASFPVPLSGPADGSEGSIPVLIEARLRTKRTTCPGPDDLAAYLQLAPDSRLELEPSWSRRPLRLRQLPGALATVVGREPARLLVRFSAAPSPATLQAAGVAVGEVATVAGSPGLDVRVSQPGAELAPRADEAVLTIAPGSGPATIQATRSIGQPARVLLSGLEADLVRAAGALRPSVARELQGSTATRLPAVTVRHRQVPRRIQLPAGRFEGFGEGDVTLTFDLPVERQALRGARLRMAADYDAPGGGRATVSVNGRIVTAETLREQGGTRFTVEEQLAGRGPALQRADLRAGENRVTVHADLGYPSGRCERPSQTGSVAVSDFGSVTLLTRPRPVEVTLSSYPFPFNEQAGWKDTTVVLPAAPTGPELAAMLEAVGTARRVSGEAALPTWQVGGTAPAGNAFVLARAGAVPAALVRGVPGPKEAGVLAASGAPGAVRIVAIGTRALAAFDGGYEIGAVCGRVAQVTPSGSVITRVTDPARVTGVERGATSWRWPLIVIIVAGSGLLLLLLRGALRRARGTRS